MEEGRTAPMIAALYGVGTTAIQTRLKEMGVLRTMSEAAKLRIIKNRNKVFGQKGSKNPAWKGGRHTRGGYINVWAPDHPRNNGGYVYEHILVWEQANNGLLSLDWIVHHLNGIKTDNRPENLAAYPRKTHDKLIPLMARKIADLEMENKTLIRTIARLLDMAGF